jgi:hypothetical protein
MGKPSFCDIGRLLLAWEEGAQHTLESIALFPGSGGAPSHTYGK